MICDQRDYEVECGLWSGCRDIELFGRDFYAANTWQPDWQEA